MKTLKKVSVKKEETLEICLMRDFVIKQPHIQTLSFILKNFWGLLPQNDIMFEENDDIEVLIRVKRGNTASK